MKIITDDYFNNEDMVIPAKWLFIAQDFLDEEELKEWLWKVTQWLGFCGMESSVNPKVKMMLDACYEESETDYSAFLEKMWNQILRNREQKRPIADRLKVMHAWTKEEQLERYNNE